MNARHLFRYARYALAACWPPSASRLRPNPDGADLAA